MDYLIFTKSLQDSADVRLKLGLYQNRCWLFDFYGKAKSEAESSSMLLSNTPITIITTSVSDVLPIFRTLRVLRNVTLKGFDGTKLLSQKELERLSRPVFLITMPKSGSVFMQQQLESALVARDWKTFGGTWYEENGQSLSQPILNEFLRNGRFTKSHLSPSAFNLSLLKDTVSRFPNTKIIVHLRDPRQAFVSWLKFYPILEGALKQAIEDKLIAMNISSLEEAFLTLFYEKMIDFIEGWYDVFQKTELSKNMIITTHEQLVHEPETLTQKLSSFVDVSPDVFSLSGKPETGKMNFRKGKTNEWKSFFSEEMLLKLNKKVNYTIFEKLNWEV